MSTSPESPPASAPEPAREPSPDARTGALVAAATLLYPFLVGGSVWVALIVGFFALGLESPETTVLVWLLASMLVSGAHWLLQRALRRQGLPRPWEFPTVITTAVVTASAVWVASMALGVDNLVGMFVFAPLTGLVMSVLGVAVLTWLGHRHRFVFALAAIVALALVLVGAVWLIAAEEDEQEREALRAEVAAFPFEIAVLDSPGWEPSQMQVIDRDAQKPGVAIVYVPVDPSPELDGFSLRLRTSPLGEEHDHEWPPLREGCASEGGSRRCEEHGDVVIVDATDEWVGSMSARMELVEGLQATLSTDMPKDKQGNPTMEFPDIDMVELSGHVRPAEPGEAREIASSVG